MLAWAVTVGTFIQAAKIRGFVLSGADGAADIQRNA